MIELTHTQVRRMIREAQAGRLPEAQRDVLNAHLEDCPACRAYLTRWSALEKNLARGLRGRWDQVNSTQENLPARVVDDIQARARRSAAVRSALLGLAALLFLAWIGYTRIAGSEGAPAPAPTQVPTAVEPTPAPVPNTFRGEILFAAQADGRSNLFLLSANPARTELTNLTRGKAQESAPAWSPDGQWIAFLSDRDRAGQPEVYVMTVAGTRVTRLTADPAITWSGPLTWSADGRYLAAVGKKLPRENGSGGGSWLFLISWDGSPPRPVEAGGYQPKFSPGYPWLAYLVPGSTEKGSAGEYLRVYDYQRGAALTLIGPGPGLAGGGLDEVFDWSTAGDTLLYVVHTGQVDPLSLAPKYQMRVTGDLDRALASAARAAGGGFVPMTGTGNGAIGNAGAINNGVGAIGNGGATGSGATNGGDSTALSVPVAVVSPGGAAAFTPDGSLLYMRRMAPGGPGRVCQVEGVQLDLWEGFRTRGSSQGAGSFGDSGGTGSDVSPGVFPRTRGTHVHSLTLSRSPLCLLQGFAQAGSTPGLAGNWLVTAAVEQPAAVTQAAANAPAGQNPSAPGLYALRVPDRLETGRPVLVERLADLPPQAGPLVPRPAVRLQAGQGPRLDILPVAAAAPKASPAPPEALLGRVLLTRESPGRLQISRLSPDGSREALLPGGQSGNCPVISPDGSKIAFISFPQAHASTWEVVYVMNADGTGLTQLTDFSDMPAGAFWGPTHIGGLGSCPSWSPDGTRVAVWVHTDKSLYLAVLAASAGPGAPDVGWHYAMVDYATAHIPPRWAPDGNSLAFFVSTGDAGLPELAQIDTRSGLVTPLAMSNGWNSVDDILYTPDGRLFYLAHTYDRLRQSIELRSLTPGDGDHPAFAGSVFFDRTHAGRADGKGAYTERTYTLPSFKVLSVNQGYGDLGWLPGVNGAPGKVGVVYRGTLDGRVPSRLFVIDPQSAQVQQAFQFSEAPRAAAWSPDGQWVIYTLNGGIWALNLPGALANQVSPAWLKEDIPAANGLFPSLAANTLPRVLDSADTWTGELRPLGGVSGQLPGSQTSRPVDNVVAEQIGEVTGLDWR